MQSVTPVTIITGFLGAGKTTILSNLLQGCPDSRIALLVNEFGQTSVDGATLRTSMVRAGEPQPVSLHEINNGLIAYASDDLFLPTMRAIDKDNHLIDNVLIETSGLALPTAVMEALQREELKTSFQLDAVLAVVDAEILVDGGFDTPGIDALADKTRQPVASLFKSQLENADVVILNKIDKFDAGLLLKCETKIRTLAPGVRFIELAFAAKIDPRIALGLRLHQAAGAAMPGSRTFHNAHGRFSFDGHSHSGLDPHEHGLDTHEHLHREDPLWLSFILRSHFMTDSALLQQALAQVCHEHPVLRLKGFVQTQNDLLSVQGVRSKIICQHSPSQALVQTHHSHAHNHGHEHSHGLEHRHMHEQESEIVFIGYNLRRDTLIDDLNKLTGGNWY